MEINFLLYLQSIRTPILSSIFEGITILGEQNAYILVISLFLWCINKDIGYKLGLTLLFNGCINTGIKDMIQRARPFGQKGLISIRMETATGYSFPSGHTQMATSFWTALALSLKKRWGYLIAATIVFFIGLSRCYLGVHWPTDVLGGWTIGFIVSYLTYTFIDKIEQQQCYSKILALLIPCLGSFFLFSDISYFKFIGAFSGLIVSYIVDKMKFNFQIPDSLGRKLAKYIFGMIGVAIIMVGSKKLIPASDTSYVLAFIKYLLLGLWLGIGAQLPFQSKEEETELATPCMEKIPIE